MLNRQKDEEATLSRDNWQSVVLLSTSKASKERGEPVPVALDSPEAELAPIPVPLSLIVAIGTDRIEVPGDVRPASVRDSVLKNLSYYVFERCASWRLSGLLRGLAEGATRFPIQDRSCSHAHVHAGKRT